MLDLLIAPVTKLLDKFIPDADTKQQIAFEIATLAEKQAHSEVLAQLEVNKAEAQTGSLFIGGWRPFSGWACGIIVVFNYMIIPLLAGVGVTIEVQEIAWLLPVWGGLLGLRTFETHKGVARES